MLYLNAIFFAKKHLWSKILGSAAEGCCPIVSAKKAVLGDSKIGEAHMSIGCDEDVLRL